MSHRTLIDTSTLAAHLADPDWAIVDARFALAEPAQGRRDYLTSHIPGAVYADLDHDLSSPHIPGRTGRHPLPPIDRFAATLAGWGIDDGVQVVVYDDFHGVYAGRLWWMLRWLGHDAVAMLDGDWRAWQQEGRPMRAGVEQRAPRAFVPRPRPELLVTVDEIAARLGDPALRLYDARGADRYRGENETVDPIGGHIPGAISAPYAGNLGADGRMFPPEALRARFTELLEGTPAEEAIFYCGSGVSVAHDLIAIEQAGLGLPRVYIGSWSEWIADPARPIATGPQP